MRGEIAQRGRPPALLGTQRFEERDHPFRVHARGEQHAQALDVRLRLVLPAVAQSAEDACALEPVGHGPADVP